MGVSNNDFNWRLVAAEDLPENTAVTIDAAGKAAKAGGTNAVGIIPQAIKAGERAPVIRCGTLSGLVGYAAGQRIRGQASGALGTAGANPVLAVVKSEDATTAVICSANLDQNL